MKELGYEVVWPRGKQVKEEAHLAKRLNTFDDKTIGFMWNGTFFGDKMFPVIEKELMKRYPRSKFVLFQEKDEAKAKVVLLDKLKEYKCDALICGVGC
jgi:hypothetical protein